MKKLTDTTEIMSTSNQHTFWLIMLLFAFLILFLIYNYPSVREWLWKPSDEDIDEQFIDRRD